MLGVECDLYRVEQGNKRHSKISTNKITKSVHQSSAAESKEFQSVDKMGKCVECITETNAIVCDDHRMASKSSNVCDNDVGNSNMPCDYSIISKKGVNKETLRSCECIVQLSSVDGFPSTQMSCSHRDAGGSLLEHSDNKYDDKYSAGLPDKMEATSIKNPPPLLTNFVIEQLSLNVTIQCVKELDKLVKNFLTSGNTILLVDECHRYTPLFIKLYIT